MKNLFARRDEKGTSTKGTPAYAFCERVTATPTSPWHVRKVGPEGLKHGGGAPDTTLCDRPLAKGWDLELPVTVAKVVELDGKTYENGAYLLCPGCASGYLAATKIESA